GEDRLRLLHAIASNTVEGLRPGQGTYSFFLSAQGRIQSDSRLFVAGDHVLLDCEPEARQTLLAHIESYIIMDDVKMADLSETTDAVALEGPQSDEIAAKALGDVLPEPAEFSHRLSPLPFGDPDPPGPVSTPGPAAIHVLRCTLTGQPGLWLIVPRPSREALVARLEAAGAAAALPEDYRVVRVENGRPRFGEDYSSSNIPHETQQLQAVSFTKGCYLGQEIVERVRSQGQVNKLLVSVELDSVEPPPPGTIVLQGGREVGRLTSPVFSPRQGKVLAFAILRREAAAEGSALAAGSAQGRVRAIG
ncbi:MAG: YgfZ/GcvT domain-containing protein, partial [bacterium]